MEGGLFKLVFLWLVEKILSVFLFIDLFRLVLDDFEIHGAVVDVDVVIVIVCEVLESARDLIGVESSGGWWFRRWNRRWILSRVLFVFSSGD